jgi:shikimate dehydrogenase
MPDTLFPAFLDNSITSTSGRFAAILGLSPSKGARSPTLWNAAFSAAGADAVMHPFDVSEAKLPGLLAALKADPRYIGGSVAVPYKKTLVTLLDRLEPEADRIGAVTYLAGNVASLRLADRSLEKAQAFAERLGGNVRGVESPKFSSDLRGVKLIINCTSIGHQDGDQASSLGDNSESLLDAMPDDTVIYDIIYQPAETELLRQAKVIGLTTLNGLGMNLDQAVIAFEKANRDLLTIDEIRNAMQSAG